jgi:hypothetical protein
MENTFNLKKVGNMDVYFRNPNCPKQAQNQPKELERVVKILTDEDFEEGWEAPAYKAPEEDFWATNS